MSKNFDLKTQIKLDLNQFTNGSLQSNSLRLLKTLGYESEKKVSLEQNTAKGFLNFLKTHSAVLPDAEKAHLAEWKSVYFLFQLTESEIRNTASIFDTSEVDNAKMESYLFFAIELSEVKKNGREFTRTDLSAITREINKAFPMPVFIMFKYGKKVTISIINRQLNKKDETRDVLKKVTLIKDIETANPKRSQIEILNDLSLDTLYKKHKFENFVELHKAWTATLDTKELNKRFFRELSNWYFWAITHVEFPNGGKADKDTHHATGVIRLITRLMFVWFLKEKGLIEEDIFNRRKLQGILNFNDKSSFYKAILQNLFFATLNTDSTDGKTKRRFESAAERKNNSSHSFFRYENEFINPEKALRDYFFKVPFLNGGLFECLDRPEENVFIDGFNKEASNALFFPDELFFSDYCEAPELNEVYDTKNKKYEVRGLIQILDNYKFTIAENTPLEEEIALDPELLGKVFENLLANYNPETKTTARKQTGSFYTPREIVDFMVDESLIAYLKGKLQTETRGFTMAVAFGSNQPTFFGNEGRKQLALEERFSINRWLGKDKELETALHELFAYDDHNPFRDNETETEILIKAINDCKIIDPACGSGAFPMGILHRLVFLLSKLDKNNIKWRELQRQIAVKETEEAFNIGDVEERQKRLLEINEVFDLNASDYGRKLFLIENCIYGVDIQPIAIQISKLRFFISLIIDQNIDEGRPNLGVRPLPNLETKLVAANTLLMLNTAAQPTLKAQIPGEKNVDELQEDLKIIRSKIFRARTPSAKEIFRVQDKQIRREIAHLLENSINPDSANKIAEWQPDNQSFSADWFDPEWMFGIEGGFDIVIGNPPYVQLHKIKSEANEIQKVGYKTFTKTGDIYCIFYELGNKILASDGILTYITSNKWMRAAYGKLLRKYLSSNTDPLILIDFGGLQVFDAATVDTNILVSQKSKNKNKLLNCVIKDDLKSLNLLSDYFRQSATKATNFNSTSSWVVLSSIEERIKSKIEQIGKPLREWDIKIYRGILTGCNEAFIIDETTKNRLIANSPKNAEIIRPILRGRNIKKFHAKLEDNWIINSHNGLRKSSLERVDVKKHYPAIYEHLQSYKDKLETRLDKGSHWTNLRNCAYLDDLEKEKIVWIELTDRPNFYLDKNGYFINNTVCFMVGERLPYILSFLNSKLCEWYFTKIAATSGAGTRRWFKVYVEQICIPQIIDSAIEDRLKILVDETQLRKAAKLSTKAIEQEIDQQIFNLFELKNEEINFILKSLA